MPYALLVLRSGRKRVGGCALQYLFWIVFYTPHSEFRIPQLEWPTFLWMTPDSNYANKIDLTPIG